MTRLGNNFCNNKLKKKYSVKYCKILEKTKNVLALQWLVFFYFYYDFSNRTFSPKDSIRPYLDETIN